MTWLYGPHQTKPGYIRVTSSSSPGSQISKPACFVARRPILKQRSASETLLQQSLNAGPSPKQTAAVVHTPSGNATCIVTPSSFSISVSKCYSGLLPCATPSGVQSLGFRDKRQIRFNDKVEQRLAVDLMHVNEVNEGNEDNEDSCVIYDDDNDAFGEGVTIMQSSLSSVADRELGRRSSFSIASKTIATLPSTTLKNYEHTRRLEGPVSNQAMKSCKAGNSSPSPSREILQLPAKFLLDVDDYDDDGMDMGWQAPRIVSYKDDSDVIELNQLQGYSFDPHGDCPGPMFPRPPYGTSIHYEEDEEALLLQLGCIQAS